MIIGVICWELHLPGCQSLKDKRRVLRSIKDRLHAKFRVSVAETAHHDIWQRAELACCLVARDKRHAEDVLTAADNLVHEKADARVIQSWIDYR